MIILRNIKHTMQKLEINLDRLKHTDHGVHIMDQLVRWPIKESIYLNCDEDTLAR